MASESVEQPKDGYLTYADGHRMVKNYAYNNRDDIGKDNYYAELLGIIDKHHLDHSDYLVSLLRQVTSERIDEVYDMSFVGMDNDKAEALIASIISFL